MPHDLTLSESTGPTVVHGSLQPLTAARRPLGGSRESCGYRQTIGDGRWSVELVEPSLADVPGLGKAAYLALMDGEGRHVWTLPLHLGAGE